MTIPLVCCAADMLYVPPKKQVVLISNDKSSPEFQNILAAANSSYDPNKTVVHVDPNDTKDIEFWEQNNAKLLRWRKVSLRRIKWWWLLFAKTSLAVLLFMTLFPCNLCYQSDLLSKLYSRTTYVMLAVTL